MPSYLDEIKNLQLGLSDLEKACILAGYQLPIGWGWDTVHATRKRLGIPQHLIPVCEADGLVAWYGRA